MGPRKPQIPVPVEPELLDRGLGLFQAHLADKLTWLDAAYGRAEKLQETQQKRAVVFPSVYAGGPVGKEYRKVWPDEHLGNFSFFDVEDGTQVRAVGRKVQKVRASVGLVVSYDFRTVYPDDWHMRTRDNVLNEVILAVISLSKPGLEIMAGKTWYEAKNVYKGYTDKEINEQYAMRPYGLLRIDIDLNVSPVSC